jgi:hypothetical protein
MGARVARSAGADRPQLVGVDTRHGVIDQRTGETIPAVVAESPAWPRGRRSASRSSLSFLLILVTQTPSSVSKSAGGRGGQSRACYEARRAMRLATGARQLPPFRQALARQLATELVA